MTNRAQVKFRPFGESTGLSEVDLGVVNSEKHGEMKLCNFILNGTDAHGNATSS